MRFEEVVDFPRERDAYMIVRKKLGLSEEEYLKLSYIERRELAKAYRLAKKLGLEKQSTLHKGYMDTSMFDEKGNYDLAEAIMIVKSKLAVLSVAKTKLGLADSDEDFILKGDKETKKVAQKIINVMNKDVSGLAEHLQPLIQTEGFLEKESRFEFQ